jgi:hypothetical protein
MVICGSMSFYRQMVEHQQMLASAGIWCVIPSSDNGFEFSLTQEEFQRHKLKTSKQHIRRIRDSKTLGILVVNYDKYENRNYIGANTFAEIAVAFAHYKKIFLYQGIPDFYRDELLAWQATPLFGRLSVLIDEYREAQAYLRSQLSLFAS